MPEYHWEILSLYATPHENGMFNVVKKIMWRFQVTDDQYYGDTYEQTDLQSPLPNKFIAYDDLSEETIIQWIKEQRNYEDLVNLVTTRLEQNKQPILTELEPPWSVLGTITGNEEYLVVIDEEPIDPLKTWGPLKWNSGLINKGLIERGFPELSVPDDMTMFRKGLIPINAPLVLSDRVKIYLVEYTESPVLDEIYQYNEGLSWVLEPNKVVGTYFVLDRTLNESKDILHQMLSEKYFNILSSGIEMIVKGVAIKVNTDLQSRFNLLQRFQIAEEDSIITCKLNHETWFKLTKSELLTVLQAIESHIDNVYSEEKNIFDQIENATTVEELKQIEV